MTSNEHLKQALETANRYRAIPESQRPVYKLEAVALLDEIERLQAKQDEWYKAEAAWNWSVLQLLRQVAKGERRASEAQAILDGHRVIEPSGHETKAPHCVADGCWLERNKASAQKASASSICGALCFGNLCQLPVYHDGKCSDQVDG